MAKPTSLERLVISRKKLALAQAQLRIALRDAILAGHETNVIAEKSGLNRSTIYRQQQSGKLPRKDIP